MIQRLHGHLRYAAYRDALVTPIAGGNQGPLLCLPGRHTGERARTTRQAQPQQAKPRKQKLGVQPRKPAKKAGAKPARKKPGKAAAGAKGRKKK